MSQHTIFERVRGMSLVRLTKRSIDVIVSVSLLILFFPVFVIVVLAILLLEGRPIFYISKRHVSVDRCVPIAKFRTMVRDAKSPKYDLHGRFMKEGYLDIPVTCEVYTGIGRWLEKSQIVEILQLFNVLFHGMSLIGNRPLPLDNLRYLERFPDWQERFASPAGMTGISQVVGKFSLQPIDRLELEKLYSKVYREGNVLKCDLEIIFFTIRLIVTGKTIPIEYAFKLLRSCL